MSENCEVRSAECGVPGKRRWRREVALAAADGVATLMRNACERMMVAGSVRRGKPMVGDVEIVYIPRYDSAVRPGEMFPESRVNLAELAIDELVRIGILEKRLNVNGSPTFGERNKLMRHVSTGIPVDLFATTEDAWWNYIVCRTGGAETNVRICNAAIVKGWNWAPYGAGFKTPEGVRAVKCERDVFDLVGLPYLEPEDRR